MHIITGLLISSLLGIKRGKKGAVGKNPKGFRNILEVRHTLPGRMRLYAPTLSGNEETAGVLQGELSKISGIRSVKVSSITGTTLIEYENRELDGRLVFAVVARLLGLENEIEQQPEPTLVTGMRDLSESLNRATYEKTGGVIDLRTLVPLVLIGYGVYKMTRPGALSMPGGFTLLWWGYTSLLRGDAGK